MKQRIAKHLLSIGAVTLRPQEPFTWASGLKSPIYCDNRLTLSYPEIRREIAAGMAQLIRTNFPGTELIAGTATAGIPHAAWVSELLDLPMVYVRGQVKTHGKQRQIEGLARPRQKAVIVEDLISTGGSVLSTAAALREAGVDLQGVVAIFTYQLPAAEKSLRDASLPLYTLTDFWTLAEVARAEGNLTEEDMDELSDWHADPPGWCGTRR